MAIALSMAAMNLLIILGTVFVYVTFSADKRKRAAELQKAKEAEEEVREIARYKKELYLNRFGAPTKPFESMDAFLNFLLNTEAINRTLKYSDKAEIVDINEDLVKGLDGWLSAVDRAVIEEEEGGHH